MTEMSYYQFARGFRMVVPHMSKVKRFVAEQCVGENILEFWLKKLTFLPRAYVEDAINAGRVTVNGAPTTLDHRLARNDVIEYAFHLHEPPVLDLPIDLLHVDKDLIVVNKPPSIPVHPVGSYQKNTVLGILREELDIDTSELYVTHRLDRPVSGVLMFARNIETARSLMDLFRYNRIKKEYVARVKGHFPAETVRVCQPIGKSNTDPPQIGIHPLGKTAVTEFERHAVLGDESIVTCRPETGRTHQIRIHLQWLGYPIVDDPKYGGLQQQTTSNKDQLEPSNYPRVPWCIECQQQRRLKSSIYNSNEWTESISLHSLSYYSTSPAWKWPPFKSPLPPWAG